MFFLELLLHVDVQGHVGDQLGGDGWLSDWLHEVDQMAVDDQQVVGGLMKERG